MSPLEHLIENGLCHLSEGKSYREWHRLMQQDCNWEGNENITIDNLWEICQHVIFTWDKEQPEIVRCKDCKFLSSPPGSIMFCEHIHKFVDAEWFCADGERR